MAGGRGICALIFRTSQTCSEIILSEGNACTCCDDRAASLQTAALSFIRSVVQ